MKDHADRPLTVRELLDTGPDEPMSELFHRAADAARKSVGGDVGDRLHDLFDALYMRLSSVEQLGFQPHQINCPLNELERLADLFPTATPTRGDA